jgi:hypothetical protein
MCLPALCGWVGSSASCVVQGFVSGQYNSTIIPRLTIPPNYNHLAQYLKEQMAYVPGDVSSNLSARGSALSYFLGRSRYSPQAR